VPQIRSRVELEIVSHLRIEEAFRCIIDIRGSGASVDSSGTLGAVDGLVLWIERWRWAQDGRASEQRIWFGGGEPSAWEFDCEGIKEGPVDYLTPSLPPCQGIRNEGHWLRIILLVRLGQTLLFQRYYGIQRGKERAILQVL
jgi:hypothetical protein